MSTNELERGTVTDLLAESPRSKVAGSGASMPGLPDPSMIARLANEFFHALPGDSFDSGVVAPFAKLAVVSPMNTDSATSPQATVPAAPPEISLPSDPHVLGLPASVGPPAILPVTASAPVTPPAVPGGAANSVPANSFGFSFLQDARPLSNEGTAGAQDPDGAGQPISNFAQPERSESLLPFTLEGDGFPAHLQLEQPPSPTVPSSFGFADSSSIPAFSFMEEARPLFSYPPSIPGPAPAVPELSTPATVPNSHLNSPQVPGAVARPQLSRTAHDDSSQTQPLPPTGRTVEPLGIESDVPTELDLSSYSFDAETLKRDFPILRERVNGRPLVWLDNAATTQKPQSVIDRLKYFYEHENSNVHRAAHELAARATDAYESAREKTRRFLNASSSREIIFVRGATEGINLIAKSWGYQNIQKDDEIVITWLEHHANIVPWQMLCAEKGARLRVVPVDNRGQILLDEYEKLLGSKTRLVSLPQVSNALGTVTPANEMVEAAHRHGAKVLVDGAQAVSHMRVDVQSLNCDFYVFSGHKVFAPTGIGVVYGTSQVLDNMPPWQGGGNMIQDVTFEKTIYQLPPQRFEAGTGNIADAVGLGAAIDYPDRVGMANISRHEHELLAYATAALQRIPGLRIIGTAKEKAGVLSFVLDGFRTEEVGDYLNRNGIAVRSGHHCAQPILRRFGLESTVRASLALYNTCEDIDALAVALWNLRQGRPSGTPT